MNRCKHCKHSLPISLGPEEIQDQNPHECIRLPPNIPGEYWTEFPVVPGERPGCSYFEKENE